MATAQTPSVETPPSPNTLEKGIESTYSPDEVETWLGERPTTTKNLSLWGKVKIGFWKVAFFNILLTGSLFFMSIASSDKGEKKKELLNTLIGEKSVSNEKGISNAKSMTDEKTDEKTDEMGGMKTEDRTPLWKALVLGLFAGLQWSPTSAMVPLTITSLIIVKAYKIVTSLDMPYSDVETFKQTCPANTRRTPYEALIKLFATAIITLGINFQRGSLIGGQSWKREVIRVLEIIISPLGTLFNFATMISYEIASTFKSNPRLWHDEPGYGYRLGRMLNCRVYTTPSQPGQYLRYVNPKHIESSPKSRAQNTKRYGHILVLIIFAVHYLQLSTLIFRRLASCTFASLDLATLFLTISAIVALTQSLLITTMTPYFTLHPDFKPCTAKSCLLSSCKDHKSSLDLPSETQQLMVFGYNCFGVPRQLLYLTAGGMLMAVITLPEKETIVGRWWWPIDMWSQVYGLHKIWKAGIYIAVTLGSMKGLMKDLWEDEKNGKRATAAEIPDRLQPASTSEQPSPTTDEKEGEAKATSKIPTSPPPAATPTWKSRVGDAAIQVALFTCGLIIPLAGVFSILFQLFYLFYPVTILGLAITKETIQMSDWNTTTACPKMWKDPYPTKLWGI